MQIEQIDRDLLDAICGPFMEFKPSVKREKLALIAGYRAAAMPELNRAQLVEIVDDEGWSLSICFGKGDAARDRMRAFSDALFEGRAAIAALGGE